MTTGKTPGTALSAGKIRQAVAGYAVGCEVSVLERVDSTSAELRRRAVAGAKEGSVVIADEQTAGHGRAATSWFSPPGVNLYLSVLFRPRIAAREVFVFSFIASLAVSDAIQAFGLTAALKWPNDVLVGRRKVAGTLVETAVRDGEVEFVILGVGVNLNVSRQALHDALGNAGHFASSLAEASGRPVDRNAFASSLLLAFDEWLEIYRRKGPAAVLAGWRDREIVTGRRVEVRAAGASCEGLAVGLDPDGYLLVKDSRGVTHRVITGEVRLVE